MVLQILPNRRQSKDKIFWVSHETVAKKGVRKTQLCRFWKTYEERTPQKVVAPSEKFAIPCLHAPHSIPLSRLHPHKALDDGAVRIEVTDLVKYKLIVKNALPVI
jgi:hypothetical protein